jgi:hypothetical protein
VSEDLETKLLAIQHAVSLTFTINDYERDVIDTPKYVPIRQYRDRLQNFLANSLLPTFHPEEIKSLIKRIRVTVKYIQQCEQLQKNPTANGLYHELFPYFNFFIDLLTKINCKIKTDDGDTTTIELMKSKIRRQLLLETITPFPDAPEREDPYAFIACREILRRSVELGILSENSEEYQRVLSQLHTSEDWEELS